MATTVLDTFITLFEYEVEGLDKVEKAGKIIGDMGRKMTRTVTLPIVAGFSGMLLAASKFEDGLDNVLNLLDANGVNTYRESLEGLQTQAVKSGFALTDVNSALFDTVSALGAGTPAIKTFEAAQQGAIAGNAELSVVVDGLTSVMNAYGKETTDASAVSEAFFTAQRAGKTTMAELAANVGKVAPLAKQAGIGYETLLASMSQLTLGGLSTDEAATALRGSIAGLLKPTKEAADVMREYNIPVGAAALQSSDFADVLTRLAQAAEENPDVLAEMIPNVRALTAIASLGTNEIDNMNNTVEQMNTNFKEGTGQLEAYNRRANNAANRTKAMYGQLQVAAKTLGDHLIPVFVKGVNVINSFFNWLENLSPATQKLVLVFMTLLAVIGPLLVGVSKLISAFTIIKTAVIALKAAQIGLNLAMLANPIGLIIAAVIALVSWFIAAYNATGNWKDALKLMGAQLIGFGQRILKFALVPTNMLINSVVTLLNLLSKIPGASKLKGLADGIKDIQGKANLTLTGSSSSNPFASRETGLLFDPSAPTPASVNGSSGVGGSKQDNRTYNFNVQQDISEASDGAQIAEQFMEGINTASRNAVQDFETSEAG